MKLWGSIDAACVPAWTKPRTHEYAAPVRVGRHGPAQGAAAMTPVRGEAGACTVPVSVDKPVENFVGIDCGLCFSPNLGSKFQLGSGG